MTASRVKVVTPGKYHITRYLVLRLFLSERHAVD